MGRHFELRLVVVPALDGADLPVVRSVLIGRSERERCLQRRGGGLPVDGVGDLDAIPGVPGAQPYRLDEPRAFGLTGNLDGNASCAALDNADVGRSVYVPAGWFLLVVPIHVPGRPVVRVLGLKGETHRGREQLFVESLVEDAADVAVRINGDPVACILDRPLADLQRRGHTRGRGLHVVNRKAGWWHIGQEEHLPSAPLRRDRCAVGPKNADSGRSTGREVECRFDDIGT